MGREKKTRCSSDKMSAIAGMSHRGRVMSLYRRLLETQRDWAVDRALFCDEALKTRAAFKSRMNEKEPKIIEQYIQDGEAMLTKYRHPNPYILPTSFGGSKYMRNP